ncbi:Sjoegren syndrome/scleroderma autoantigen 1 homolog [Dendronephthya gigantea]|uniref:Sjoegren syndrome/scleroderma autoantigen 1 homolog n=1 Tax=Dendronephthya gigantea TaxID=151771 RepID=UPI00106961F5|nr:Sjoegren syndrome/scleroderma autoantigen 1 homolog [Dendronephthya gigantea]
MSQTDKKRARDDKIGKLMGEYLLKGYKMLGSTCNVCGTILLKDRQQQDYCIGCSELDNHLPVTHTHFTSQVQPMPSYMAQQIGTQHESQNDENPEHNDNHPGSGGSTSLNEDRTTHLISQTNLKTVDEAMLKLERRLLWAANQLGMASSVEMDIKLCELICHCGNALKTLKELK